MKNLPDIYEFKKVEEFRLPKKCNHCGYEYESDHCPKCNEKEIEECIGFHF
jgi:predicted Zn-ribbon and HTH transcriptional regulator